MELSGFRAIAYYITRWLLIIVLSPLTALLVGIPISLVFRDIVRIPGLFALVYLLGSPLFLILFHTRLFEFLFSARVFGLLSKQEWLGVFAVKWLFYAMLCYFSDLFLLRPALGVVLASVVLIDFLLDHKLRGRFDDNRDWFLGCKEDSDFLLEGSLAERVIAEGPRGGIERMFVGSFLGFTDSDVRETRHHLIYSTKTARRGLCRYELLKGGAVK